MISIVPGIILPQHHIAFLMGFINVFSRKATVFLFLFFFTAGKMFLTEILYKKNIPLDNQSKVKAKSSSQPVNLPDAWSFIIMKPLLLIL